jgi:outer membrane biosynthesis protein TonB
LLVAVLFHALVLWLVMHPTRLVLKKPVSSEAGKMVWIQPLTAPPQAVVKLPPSPSLILPSKPKAPPKSVPVPKAELAQQKPVAQPPAPPPVPAPVLPTITTPVPTPPPVEDMMAQIEAKQRSRAQARNSQVESQSQEESENQRGVRQAQANIANLQAKAAVFLGSGRSVIIRPSLRLMVGIRIFGVNGRNWWRLSLAMSGISKQRSLKA